jgi:hypothetical protein
MADFASARTQLRQARSALDAALTVAAGAVQHRRAITAEIATFVRSLNPRVAEAAAKRHRLDAQAKNAEAAVTQAQDGVEVARNALHAATADFATFADPRQNIGRLSSRFPFALLPVRVETRFATFGGDNEQQQLWVRIYPDDCWIDTFEATLSASELANAQRYWRAIWRAGGIEADQRAAWRALAASHGSSRANYIVDAYQPVNLVDQPTKRSATDEILVIPTQTALGPPEAAAVGSYWQSIWLADGDATKVRAAFTALQVAVGANRATQLVAAYIPYNLSDARQPPLKKSDIGVNTAFVVFPPDPQTQTDTWSQAPRISHFPDCFVVLGFSDGVQTLSAIGSPITLPLVVGPDPSAQPDQTIHPVAQTGDLFVPDELRWMVDFQRAVAAGMGLAIDLSGDQANTGFDRLLVLGLQLSANAIDGQAALEELLRHHTLGRSGLSLVEQGTPCHNTVGKGTGYTRFDDPDQSFDDRRNAPLFSPTRDPQQKRDGQWLAEALGVEPTIFASVHGAGGADQIQVRAMQRALWPATLGYWMDKLLAPVFSDDTVASTRWFFTNYVSGRGAVPAIRIGNQPYGILPTTAFSRIASLKGELPPAGLAAFSRGQIPFLAALYAILRSVDSDWTSMSASVSHVGKPGDAHQILLDIIGLHPASVEFHARYAESLTELFNIVNIWGLGPDFWQAILALALEAAGEQLLARLGYAGAQQPDVLQHVFLTDANPVANVVDDRPLSESAPVRAYTDDGRNYIKWLLDAAKTALDALVQEQGFTGNQTPQTLLYLYLRHALMLGYYDTSYELHKSAGFLSASQLAAMKPEPVFVHVDTSTAVSESRFSALYKTESRITSSPSLLVSDYITANFAVLPEAENFSEQLDALSVLADAPTAALERLFAEHIDICSYRFDAWLLGLVNVQLQTMRSLGGIVPETRTGVYLGAYAWLEDVRPSNIQLQSVQLPPDLAEIFGGAPALLQDPTNGGYIHAPSLAHARTAAVLRSGYLANATAANPQSLTVNLSSDRVRLALSMLEGIRNGQSLGALLGYRFERGLHDDHDLAEVDKFIFPLRKAFPLVANAISTTAELDPGVPIQALEARNVMDGRKLVSQIQSSGNANYPFGIAMLPPATAAESAAIDAETSRLLDLYDAIADLALAEGVHQAVQGNFERIGATLDAYSSGSFPPEPEVVQTPANGIGLTHRVAVHFRPGLAAPVGATPRAMAEPALDAWLETLLPSLDRIGCAVAWKDPVANADHSQPVTLADLNLRPIDVLDLVRPENSQAMTELDDRIVGYVLRTSALRPDAQLQIQYMTPPAGLFSIFEGSALVRNLKALLVRARPLRDSDALLRNDATPDSDATAIIDATRIAVPLAALATLSRDVKTYLDGLAPLVADPLANRAAILAGIDIFLADAAALLERAARFNLPQSGWGFIFDWKRVAFADLIAAVRALVTRWDAKLADYDARIAAYDALPPGTADADRFKALRAAELVIATSLDPLPAAPAILRAALDAKRAAFAARRDQFDGILATADPSFNNLLEAVKAGLPITAFDPQSFDISGFENRAIVITQDLVRTLSGHLTAIDARRTATQAQLDVRNNAASPADQTQALQASAKALLGDGFTVYPEFQLSASQADEWANAYAFSTSGALLEYLTGTARIDFPIDEWLAGVARVRPAMRAWEAITGLVGAFGGVEPLLTPVQFPFEANASWVAMQYPPQYVLDSDRLLYTAHYSQAFDKTARQCGLLLDEWTEVIPSPDRTTGITFNFDRPNSEAPQAILLVTPASVNEAWQWDDLVGALNETLDLAKKRAVEPVQLDNTAYSRFLPATIMAATLYGISITTSLAAANGVFVYLQQRT